MIGTQKKMEPEIRLLSREDLLTATERRFKTVGPLPVRGGHVRLQSLWENEASNLEAQNYTRGEFDASKMLSANCRYLVACLVDQAGNRLLSAADVATLMAKWDRADIEYVYTEARLHVRAKKRPIEELEKNFAGTPADN